MPAISRVSERATCAELAALPQEASLHALRMHVGSKKGKPSEKAQITGADFATAFERLKKQHSEMPAQASYA